MYTLRRRGRLTSDPSVDSTIELMRRKRFDPLWVEAFLDAMEADLVRSECDTMDEVLRYTYGSAEVIGLFMARILDLPEASLPSARMLGRAMQYVNYIRDFAEEVSLGRRYLPLEGLPGVSKEYAADHPDEFASFTRGHLIRCHSWQAEAQAGCRRIPRRYRIPIKTAPDMYGWTAKRIADDHFVVFERKTKPSPRRIAGRAPANVLFAQP